MDKQIKDSKTELQSSRRKLLIKSAKIAPVITAVAAAPVWATSSATSGNQSGNVSTTSNVVKFSGNSHYHYCDRKRLKNKSRSSQYSRSSSYSTAQSSSASSQEVASPLPDYFYAKSYGGVSGIFPKSMLFASVGDILDPNNWSCGSESVNINGETVTIVDRYMLTAFLNAHPTFGASGFPYTRREIKRFCKDYERGRVSYSDAKLILSNLIDDSQGMFSAEVNSVC